MDNPERERQRSSGHVFVGLVIVLVGLVMLAERTGLDGIHLSGHFWPFILIALGAVKSLDPGEHGGRRRSRRGGLWLMYVGGWGLVNEFHLFGLDYGSSWPLLIIGAGVGLVWRAFDHPGGCTRVRES